QRLGGGEARVEVAQAAQLFEGFAQLVELGAELVAQLLAGAGGVLAQLPDRAAHPLRGTREALRPEDEQPGHDEDEDLPPPDAFEHGSTLPASVPGERDRDREGA